LKEIVENNGQLTWNQIANEMRKIFPSKNRIGKQYRERYAHHVQYQGNWRMENHWNQTEIQMLYRKFKERGTKWN
jgi:hypothetical protein